MKNQADKQPTGKALLSLLIDLLADQEGVKITYEIKETNKE